MQFCYTNFRKLKGSHILKYGNDSASLDSLIIDTFLTTIHLIKGISSKMSILSLCILACAFRQKVAFSHISSLEKIGRDFCII